MILSVDISTEFIHMIQVRQSHNQLEITGFCRMETPEGCVKNGIVLAPAALGEALGRMARENGFRAKKLAFSVASPAITYHELTVPVAGKRDLQRLLQQETSQLVTTQKEQLMDYVVLGTVRDEQKGGELYRVWCAIAPRALVEGYRDAAQKGGFQPVFCDVVANAAYKANRVSGAPRGETAIYAGVREDELCLSLFTGGRERFYRNVPISAPKGPVENEFILSSMVASAADGEAGRRERMTRTAASQLSKLQQFQLMRDKENPVARVCLCSDRALDSELAETLRDTLRVEVRPAVRPDAVRCAEGFAYSEYLYAVGAAIWF